jgi:phage terminase Nu1 subunit (DNA packaging protein)
MARNKAENEGKTIVGRAKLAKIVGVGSRQISYYVENGMPQEGAGKFCLESCVEWVKSHVKPTGRGDGRQKNDRGHWETQKVRWQAKQEALKYRQQVGELIPVDEVSREQERAITHAKALAEQIPDRLLGLLPKTIGAKTKKEFRNSANEMIEDFLFALSDWEIDTIHDSDVEPKGTIQAAEIGGMEADSPNADAGVVLVKHQTSKRSKQQSRKV